MGKPTICIGENKDADQLTAKLISAFVFATRIVQFLFYLNPKFQASSSFLCLYRPVYVGPVRKPHCWFSHEAAHFFFPIVCSRKSMHYSNNSMCNNIQLSLCVRKPTLWVPTRSDTNQSVQSQKMVRGWKFWI